MQESQRGAAVVLVTRAAVHQAACCRAPRVLHKAACSKYLDEIASRSTFASIFFSAVYQLMLDVDGKRRWLNMSSHVPRATTYATSGLNARQRPDCTPLAKYGHTTTGDRIGACPAPARPADGPRVVPGRFPVQGAMLRRLCTWI